MPKIIILPHIEICPNGEVIDAKPGLSICENLLQNHIEIEHACDQVCACTTCHVIIREGFETLNQADDLVAHQHQSDRGRQGEEERQTDRFGQRLAEVHHVAARRDFGHRR